MDREPVGMNAFVVLLTLLLATLSTSSYVVARGWEFLEHNQLARFTLMLRRYSGNPWQYRVLALYWVEGLLTLAERMHVPDHVATTFVAARVAQDTIIYLVAFAYYRRLGVSEPAALVGLALLAWSVSYSHYDTDLSFNTFFDVMFYLLAGLCLVQGAPRWLIPITLLAALNRETSALIPFLPAAVAWFAPERGALRQTIPVVASTILIYVAVFVGLRAYYGAQYLITPLGHRPGIDLLRYNLFRAVTWQQLLLTFNIVPFIAFSTYRRWRPELRAFCWAVVPVWLVAHALGGVMAESRLFLVPQALVFIPGALAGFQVSINGRFWVSSEGSVIPATVASSAGAVDRERPPSTVESFTTGT